MTKNSWFVLFFFARNQKIVKFMPGLLAHSSWLQHQNYTNWNMLLHFNNLKDLFWLLYSMVNNTLRICINIVNWFMYVTPVEQSGLLIHLKFEKWLRLFQPQGLWWPVCPPPDFSWINCILKMKCLFIVAKAFGENHARLV